MFWNQCCDACKGIAMTGRPLKNIKGCQCWFFGPKKCFSWAKIHIFGTASHFFVTNTRDHQKGNLFCASPVAIWTPGRPLGPKNSIFGSKRARKRPAEWAPTGKPKNGLYGPKIHFLATPSKFFVTIMTVHQKGKVFVLNPLHGGLGAAARAHFWPENLHFLLYTHINFPWMFGIFLLFGLCILVNDIVQMIKVSKDQ